MELLLVYVKLLYATLHNTRTLAPWKKLFISIHLVKFYN